jgi:hypothetical protein
MFLPTEIPMKIFFHSLLLSAVLAGHAAAQTNLVGTWQGRLEVAPGNTLAIHFVIAAVPGGSYSVVVTSPDSGAIKNVPATRVTFADNRLTVDVPALSGGYAGTLRNGVFEGEWSQQGSKLPLSLRPYEKPTLTQADINALRGEWFGKLNAAGTEVTIVLRLSTGSDGAVRAVLDVPEQGVKDWEGKNVALDDGHVSIEIPGARAKVTGTLKGDQIGGQWIQLGNALPLTLKKGRYVAAVSYLDLPAAVRAQLKGHWSGRLGGLAVSMRFETDSQGRTRGFFDSTQQNLLNIPITQAELVGTKLTFGLAFGAKYTGELAADQMTGEWTQAGLPKPLPLTLKKGLPEQSYLDLPAAAREQLKGRWSGTLNRLAVVVRFETDAQGRTLGFFDSTQQNILNIPITQAELTGTKLTFGVSTGGKYEAELGSGKLTGEWTQPGLPKPLPLVLTREK